MRLPDDPMPLWRWLLWWTLFTTLAWAALGLVFAAGSLLSDDPDARDAGNVFGAVLVQSGVGVVMGLFLGIVTRFMSTYANRLPDHNTNDTEASGDPEPELPSYARWGKFFGQLGLMGSAAFVLLAVIASTVGAETDEGPWAGIGAGFVLMALFGFAAWLVSKCVGLVVKVAARRSR